MRVPAEATLWRYLRNRNLRYEFRRQHPIVFSIIDFLLCKREILIEIDGQSHLENSQVEYDQARTEHLESPGYKVIRFMNDGIRYNINAVVTRIIEEADLRSREVQK